jgi:hypothetical protein
MIVSNNLVWSGETWSDDNTGTRTYVELYRIVTDDPNESAVTIRAAVPAPYTPFPNDNAAVVKKRSARRADDSRLIWEVTVEYSFDSKEPEEPEESPLNRPAKIRWTSTLVNRAVVRDIDGDAVVNSAGDYFDPPPEAEYPRWTATIQFNAATVPVGILSYAGARNNAAIVVDGVSVSEERARITSLDIGEVTQENDVSFRSITLAVECRDDGDDSFDIEPLDQGFRFKDGTTLKDILIEDEEGKKNRPSAPVLLDGAGAVLANPSTSTAVFLSFVVCRSLDLTVFPGIEAA